MNPRVFHCPRCGAPISQDAASKLAPRTNCNFCGATIDMGGDAWARLYQQELSRPPKPADARPPLPHEGAPPAPASPPSPFWQRLAWVLRPVCGLLLGFGLFQCIMALLKNSSPHPIPTAVLVGIAALVLQAIGLKIPALILIFLSGLLLFLKPFVNPVIWSDGHVFGITSETHLNYLVPASILMVIALLILLSLRKSEGQKNKGLMYGVFAAGFAIGICSPLFSASLFGPTRGELLNQYKSRFDPLREMFKAFHAQLPAAGSLKEEKIRRDLNPAPEYQKNSKTPPNTEIINAWQLLDQSERGHFDLLLSDDLARALLWTSDKNPMVSSSMDESDSNFALELEKALKIRWLAVYRPVGGGSSYGSSTSANGLEIFVFDLQSKELVAQGLVGRIDSYSDGQEKLARALERITGGRFSF